MTTVMEERERARGRVSTVETAGRRSPLLVGFIALLTGLIGFGVGWLVFRDTGVDVPSGVAELLDGYEAAWIANDGDLAVEAMTPTAAHVSSFTGRRGFSGEQLATWIDGLGEFTIENSETVGVFGDLPYLVVISQRVVDEDGYSVYRIVDVAGELKIANHAWYLDR